jgi:hypothetical protein
MSSVEQEEQQLVDAINDNEVSEPQDGNEDVGIESKTDLFEDGYAHTDTESEYEEVDITENPLYQVLSVFFEDDNGKNLCSKLDDITDAINRNTRVQQALLKHLASNGGIGNSSGNSRRSGRSSDSSRRSRPAPRK